jgi:hypothetical protein
MNVESILFSDTLFILIHLIRQDGTLDRKKLGQLTFGSDEATVKRRKVRRNWYHPGLHLV